MALSRMAPRLVGMTFKLALRANIMALRTLRHAGRVLLLLRNDLRLAVVAMSLVDGPETGHCGPETG